MFTGLVLLSIKFGEHNSKPSDFMKVGEFYGQVIEFQIVTTRTA
jgi:hypothetical protein